MKPTNPEYDKRSNIVHWVARIVGSLSAALFLFIGIVELISNTEPLTFEGRMIGAFGVIFMIGVLIAWWKEGIGGIVLITSAIAFGIFIYLTAGRNRLLASVLISSPFSISGVLFYLTRRKRVSSE